MKRVRVLILCALGVAVSILGVIVTHDFLQVLSLSPSLLCERPDGTLWRDASNGCTGGEDPLCDGGLGCESASPVSEGWRHACTWLFFEEEVPPRGEEPFYSGPSPGRGCVGRA